MTRALLYICLVACGLYGAHGNTCTDASSFGYGYAASGMECKYQKQCTVDSGKVPGAPTGYSVLCNNGTSGTQDGAACHGVDIAFDTRASSVSVSGSWTGELLAASCTNSVADCATKCDLTPGCCGFNFQFNEGQYSSGVGRCVAKACESGTEELRTSRYGMAMYKRTAGAVASQAPTPSPYSSSGSVSSACDREEEFKTAVLGGNTAGIILGLVFIVLASLPICCGKLVKQRKIIGGLAIAFGVIDLFVPMIAGMGAGTSACNTWCDEVKCNPNGCTAEVKDGCLAFMNGLGVFVAYIAYGFLCVIFGILDIALGASACCGCCKAKDADANVSPQVVVVQEAPKQ